MSSQSTALASSSLVRDARWICAPNRDTRTCRSSLAWLPVLSLEASPLLPLPDTHATLDEQERLAQQEEVRRTLKAMRDNPPKRALTVDSGLAR